jgi:hypothetical protein
MACRNRSRLLYYTVLGGGLVAFAATLAPSHARADADDKVNRLIQLLIQKKVLDTKQAHELLEETNAPAKPKRRAPVATTPEAAPPAKPGEIRVTYVPDFIRKQIADQVRAQVMTEAETEGWAAPDALPEWTKRFTLYGVMRVRYERDSFGQGNSNQFTNFASINNGSAFDANNYGTGSLAQGNPPFLNTTEDRDRPRVRARLGVLADIDEGWTADFRFTTGADNGPVSPNQTMGTPGDFAKYNVYIDRASLSYTPAPGVTLWAGREANPFFTTDLIFYNELNFDGIAAKVNEPLTSGLRGFVSGGVFPVFNTAFDFSTNSDEKFGSTNAYLFAIQGGFDWQVRPNLQAKLGVGFFDFNGVQGAVSQPCNVQLGNVYTCSTDDTRFPFQQFGNTVYAIRNIVTVPTAPPAVSPNPQYYGLASRFAVLEVHPRVEIDNFLPVQVAISGEYLKNLAYDRDAILDHGPPNGPIGPQNNVIGKNFYYEGGDTAYMVRAEVGQLQIKKRWDWNVMLAYKYLQTDPTLDSINDSDFHLGGTNAKGYILTGSLGVAHNTFVSLRWFSAQVVSGPRDDNDVVQLDLQSSF